MGDFLFWVQGPMGAQDLHLAKGLSSGALNQRIYASVEAIPDAVRGDRLQPPYSLELLLPTLDPSDGIDIDPTTGEVTVTDRLPSSDYRVMQLDVGAQLRHQQQGPVGTPLYQRIWIHETLEQVWPSPRRLTLHEDQRGVARLRPIARFTDGGTPFDADVSAWLPFSDPGVDDRYFTHATAEGVPLLEWSASSNRVLVTSKGRVVLAGSGPETVTLTTRHTGVAPATATVVATTPWTTPTTVRFLGGAGKALAPSVPNVLFLPDGFLAEDEELFETMLQTLVRTLSGEDALQPFPLLADHLNYWWAWLPSAERGITLLREGARVADRTFAEFGPRSAADPATPTVDDVANQVGHVVLEVNDTVFHLGRGDRQRIQGQDLDRTIGIDPDLLDLADFDDFLSSLTDPEVPSIGRRWTSTGEDGAFVVLIGLSSFNSGTHHSRGAAGGLIAFSTGITDTAPIREAADGVHLDHAVVPATRTDLDLASLLGHELGHALGLGDEYTEAPDWPTAETGYGNLHARSEISDPATGRLDGARIRWGWPRIDAAAVLTGTPQPSQEPLRPGDAAWTPDRRVLLTVRPGEADQFDVGALVRVRTRPLLDAVTSSQHRITAVDRWAEDDAVELEPLGTGSDLLAPPALVPFIAGSLLFRARPDDEPGPVQGEASMIHPAVRDHLTARSNPLNAALSAVDDRACVTTEPRTAPIHATNLPPGLVLPPGVPSWNLVGLYEGGGMVACGTYHPAGACMMNTRIAVDPATTAILAVPFCAVCRYLIVDRIHPPAHPIVDELYDRIYPAMSTGATP